VLHLVNRWCFSDGTNYKRSRSEDNILQVNGEEEYIEDPESPITCTPSLIGEAMCRDDPFYEPSISNPFAAMAGFQKGGKILGQSFCDVDPMMETMFELPSPSSPTTPPCTPNLVAASVNVKRTSTVTVQRKSQSLPSSPVLLRKAAEKFHQESIHGSNCNKKTVNPKRYSFSAYGSRSKSVFFPEAVAQRLQFDMFDTDSSGSGTGRSRESSVESDANMNLISKLPRRHSHIESIQSTGDSSFRNSEEFTHIRAEVNGRGDNQVLGEINKGEINKKQGSVYPGLKYASESSAKSEKKCVNNNILPPSPVESKVNYPDTFRENMGFNRSLSLPSSPRDCENCDPWTMRREKFKTKSTTIMEETFSSSELMETSV